MNRLSAYCTASKYNLKRLSKSLEGNGVTFFGNEVLCFPYGNGLVFAFDYGVFVFWNLEQGEEWSLIKAVEPYQKEPLEDHEFDEFTYELGSPNSMKHDHIKIASLDDILTVLSFSFALAQSVKLSTYEARIEKSLEDADHISMALAKTGRIPLSRKAIGMKIGALFRERNSINVQSAFLEVPDFFWEFPELEPIYKIASGDLDVVERTLTLNNKLDMIHDLYQILGDELHAKHGEILEVTIIILILIEVIFASINFFSSGGILH